MATPEAGWYPDPSGDATRLRYWDGACWTNDYMDASQAFSAAGYAPAGGASTAAAADAADAAGAPGAAAGVQGASVAGQPGQAAYGSAPYVAQDNRGVYANPVYATVVQEASYPRDSTSRTMLLIAFIFMLVDTICAAFLVIPLAWMIPMTVRAWGIYKGTRPNTTGFGVCTLIFVSLVSGILMLCCEKDA